MSKIEQGIEIPHPPFKIKWHFGDFEIGDSKAIPYEDNELEVTRFRVAASAYGKRNGKVFTSRSNFEDGVRMLRIWRVE
jgi:hypothetical protein